MAAKFEVYIASKKYPSIKMCETIFPIVGKIQFSENVLFGMAGCQQKKMCFTRKMMNKLNGAY